MRTTMHANRPFSTVLLRRRAYGYILGSGSAPPPAADRELIDDNGTDLELIANASTDHELL
jgi:hypothetical protein